MKNHVRSVLVGLSVVVLSGCATARAKDKMEMLRKSVEAYNHAFRWKNYDRAATFLPAELRGAFVATHEDDAASLHVEDYKILQVDIDTEDAARVLVRYRYTLLPSVVVQTRKLTQHWHRVAGQWTLENEDEPIRPVNRSSKPSRPDAFGGDQPESESTEVEVLDAEGVILRSDGDWEDEERNAR